MPNVRVIYWSMRVMAFTGVLMFLVAVVGAWLLLEAEAGAGALVPLDGVVAIAFLRTSPRPPAGS